MEVIGFILGVAGVIAPAYQAVEALTDRVSAIKNFPKTLRTFNAQFSLQKKLFDNECILLFSSEFDETLIREMLRNEKHPMWEDREFQQKFRDHLGDFFGQSVLLPFGIITETVRQLEKEIDLVTIGDKGKPGTLKHVKGLYRKLQRPSEMPNMDALLVVLRAQILDLLNLRKQREAAQKRRYRSSGGELKNSTATASESQTVDLLPQVLELQKSSKRVYAAIASVVANCSCHNFYFQLQCEKEKVDANFKLVLTTGLEGGAEEEEEKRQLCTCIAVRKEAGTPPSSPPPAYTPTRKATAEIPTKKPKKKLEFVYPVTTDSSKTLTDLCSTVRSISTCTPSYLGALPSTDPHRHLYTEYHKPSISRLSLPRVFDRASLSRVRSVLPPTRRYRLAWILAASVLRFGFNTAAANAWIRANWRSGDIYFLQDHDAPEEALDFPHISVRFNPTSSSPESANGGFGTCLAKNEQLYSLAIALIEIGYGATLRNLCDEGVEKMEWNHAREYAGAKDLAESIGQVMSRRYAMVVRRCFYASFGVDEADLTPASLQRAYYEKVECELRRCLVEFSGMG